MGQLLRRHDPEGEAGVREFDGQVVRRAQSALLEGVEADFAGVADALVEGLEGSPSVEVWRVDDVPGFAQAVGKGVNAFGQSLSVVEQQDLGHGGDLPREAMVNDDARTDGIVRSGRSTSAMPGL